MNKYPRTTLQSINFPTARPSEAGVPEEAVCEFLTHLQTTGVPMHAVLLARHGKLIAEGYYAPFERNRLHRMFSVTKSLNALAIGLLEADGLSNPRLILNRIRTDMVRRGDMMSIEDVKDILAVDILGVIPDDENIVVSSNKGDPAVNDSKSKAGQAYRNIVDRLMGQELPLMELDNKKGVFGKIKKLLAI